MSKELVMKERLTPEAELHFTAVVLTRKAKCAEALNQRKWVVNRVLTNQGVVIEDVLRRELVVAEAAAARYPNNYHAWNHRMWALNLMAAKCTDEKLILAQEWQSSSNWVASHVSDHSGMQYRQYLMDRIASIKAEQVSNKQQSNIFQILH
jgi:protein prenyltransferase alpha subunit repeat containing protein 1